MICPKCYNTNIKEEAEWIWCPHCKIKWSKDYVRGWNDCKDAFYEVERREKCQDAKDVAGQ